MLFCVLKNSGFISDRRGSGNVSRTNGLGPTRTFPGAQFPIAWCPLSAAFRHSEEISLSCRESVCRFA